ncbi:MAG: adenylate kinase [Candidatus Omnitrophota bacterium]|mgnify:FL=1
MRIILLGPPGAGKGTQAKLLKENFNLAHISTGDLLRKAVADNTIIGKTVKSYMDKGNLVPDNLVIELLKERLSLQDINCGFILDGFPRNVAQAQVLDKVFRDRNLNIDYVIYLKADAPVIIQRLSGRRVCSKCQANFHITNMPPKKEGICDNCGSHLYQRNDDKVEAIKNRLKVYLKETASLIGYYLKQNKLFEMDANFPAPLVFEKIKNVFSNPTRIVLPDP